MAQVLAKCDLFRAQIAHLRTVFPYVHVAPYTRDLHTVKVYVDLQWRCQVCVEYWICCTGFVCVKYWICSLELQ